MNVSTIKNNGVSALIHWEDEDGVHKGTIPSNLLHNDNTVKDAHLTMAIPYGVDWALLISEDKAYRTVTPDDIAKSLHDQGIWTVADARRNPGAVHGAILSAYGVTFQTIMRVAEIHISNGGSANG